MNRNTIGAGVAMALVAGLALAQDGAYHYFNHAPDPRLGERAREFAIENKVLQDESTNMPVGSPPVDRTEKAADPLPKATTPEQRATNALAEERFLEQNSTR